MEGLTPAIAAEDNTQENVWIDGLKLLNMDETYA